MSLLEIAWWLIVPFGALAQPNTPRSVPHFGFAKVTFRVFWSHFQFSKSVDINVKLIIMIQITKKYVPPNANTISIYIKYQ